MRNLSRKEARAKRDQAIDQVEAAADEAWKAHAFSFIENYSRSHEFVFCDDLWKAGLVHPREPRALGAVVRRLARAGLIEHAGRHQNSVHSNMGPKSVWVSLVYEPKKSWSCANAIEPNSRPTKKEIVEAIEELRLIHRKILFSDNLVRVCIWLKKTSER